MIKTKKFVPVRDILAYVESTGIVYSVPYSNEKGYVDNICIPTESNPTALFWQSGEVVVAHNVIATNYPRLLFAKIVHDVFGYIDDGEVLIGDNLFLGELCVFGDSGYGYVWDHTKCKYLPFPHLGKVIIGDNVTIHNCVTIDRGALCDTVIGDGTKIGSHVHIGHNAQIGKNCLIVTKATIGGSAKIGDNVFVGRGADVGNCIVEDGAIIGKMSNVLDKTYVDKDEVWAGNPAVFLRMRRKSDDL